MIHQLLTCYNIDIRRYCCSLNLLLYVLLIFVFRLSLLLSYFLYKNLLVLHWRKKCLSKFSISFKYSAISVEMYYIFATLWGREQYALYGILFIVYGILIGVTACISVALTYFQLSAEDYRWWWRSIFSAGYVSRAKCYTPSSRNHLPLKDFFLVYHFSRKIFLLHVKYNLGSEIY